MNKFQQSAHSASGPNHQTAGHGSGYYTDRTIQSAPAPNGPVQNDVYAATNHVSTQPVPNNLHPQAQAQAQAQAQSARQMSGQISGPVVSQCDDELAQLFQQIRQLTGTDLATLASHLQTSPEILASFERGEYNAFPPWAETVRIVSSLTLLVNVDCEPILARITQKSHQPAPVQMQVEPAPQRQQTQQTQPTQHAPQVSQVPQVSQSRQAPQQSPANPGISQSRQPVQTKSDSRIIALASLKQSIFSKRYLGLATIPLVLVAAFFMATTSAQKNGIAGPLGNYAKAGWEFFSWNSTKDGLRWIKTSDPRTRKADKLPINDNDG